MDWQKLHRTMGCFECAKADREYLGKSPCCTRPGAIQVDKAGRCLYSISAKALQVAKELDIDFLGLQKDKNGTDQWMTFRDPCTGTTFLVPVKAEDLLKATCDKLYEGRASFKKENSDQ